jgi:alkanesulfonate monooxygenase SsuD/methylene tetrahydromethanopterin reductase-like flavin-dependent oxidoreductase (luciferase family)
MTKVIVQVYPTLGNLEEMEALRPIGRNNGAFQALLDDLMQLALAADVLGYWGLSHTEHHFHSEGLELSPDPGLYNLFLGTRTRRLHHGQLGYVLPSHDPIRLAERTAMIDHMIGGRLFVGMTRGYQTRWVDVLAQRMGTGTADHGDGDADARNWELFREHYRLLKMAWTRDVVRYQGANYQVPGPNHPGAPTGGGGRPRTLLPVGSGGGRTRRGARRGARTDQDFPHGRHPGGRIGGQRALRQSDLGSVVPTFRFPGAVPPTG